ncbi:site-specific integrase [Actinocorallia lasiicapitis]
MSASAGPTTTTAALVPSAPAPENPAPVPAGELGTDRGLSVEAAAAVAAGVPEETRRAYAGDWSRFTAWCSSPDVARKALPCTAETITEYATFLKGQGLRPGTISRALSSIRVVHRTAGYPAQPDLLGARKVISGWADELARTRNEPRAVPRRAAPAVPTSLKLMVGALDSTPAKNARDACLMVLGFAVAARRSELVEVNLEDVEETVEGLDVRVYRGKKRTVQQVAVLYGQHAATCPVRTFQRWRDILAAEGRTSGPLFVRIDRHGRFAVPLKRNGKVIGHPDGRLSDGAVADIIAAAALAAGLASASSTPGALPPRWSGHSLRRGFATASRRAKHDLVRVGRHGGWTDGSKSLLAYFEDADRWDDNALDGIGL